jgi:hypothetical protein
MRRLLAGPWDESRIVSDIERLQAILQPQSTLSAEFVQEATVPTLEFIEARRSEIEAELPAPGPDWPTDVVADVSGDADRPAMTVTGTFTAPWTTTPPENPMASGAATLAFAVEGEAPIALENGAAFALSNPETLEGLAAIRKNYTAVTLTVPAGARLWQVVLTIDPHQLTTETRELPVDHFTVWAILVDVDPADPEALPNLRIFGVVGEVRFDEVSAVEGGQITGTFTLRTRAM